MYRRERYHYAARVGGGRRPMKRPTPMLRVITDRRGNNYRLDLHGVLGGDWVPLVEQHWRAIRKETPFASVTVVLTNVEFIDKDGEQLLHRMADADVQFVVTGCMNRYVVDRLRPPVGVSKARL